MPTVSVLVRFRDHIKTLPLLLSSLDQQDLEYQLVGVDSGSGDGCRALFRVRDALLVNIDPASYSTGRALNDGIAAASGDIVVFVSAHAVPDAPEALARLIAPLDRPGVAGAYGFQRPSQDMNPFSAAMIRDYYGEQPMTLTNDPRFSNAWAAIRREVWTRHRFSEVVSAAEDQLWAKEVQRHGYAVTYVPEARLTYHQDFTLRALHTRALRQGFALRVVHRGRAPRLRGALASALQMTIQDIRAWRRGELNLHWLLRSPGYRLANELGRYRGVRMAVRALD
jgi:rhamnosyltransferase